MMLEILSEMVERDITVDMIDSTVVPGTSLCYRYKIGAQKIEVLGRSRGGFTTRVHAQYDAKGHLLGFVLTPGQTHDI